MKKMAIVFLFNCCFLFTIGQKSNLDFKSIIGCEFDKINEIEKLKNFYIEEIIGIRESLNNTNGFRKISDGKNTLILFTKHIPPNRSKILAILNIGMVDIGAKIFMAMCRIDKKNDGYIVAIVNTRPRKEYFNDVTKAWRVNLKTNKFDNISVKGIDCLNSEFDN